MEMGDLEANKKSRARGSYWAVLNTGKLGLPWKASSAEKENPRSITNDGPRRIWPSIRPRVASRFSSGFHPLVGPAAPSVDSWQASRVREAGGKSSPIGRMRARPANSLCCTGGKNFAAAVPSMRSFRRQMKNLSQDRSSRWKKLIRPFVTRLSFTGFARNVPIPRLSRIRSRAL